MGKSFDETLAELKVYLGSDYWTYNTIMRELTQFRNSSGGRLALSRTSHRPELADGPPPAHKLVGRYKLTDYSIVSEAKEHLKTSDTAVAIVFLDESTKEIILYRSITFQEFEKGM
jgi:hypothetical protein